MPSFQAPRPGSSALRRSAFVIAALVATSAIATAQIIRTEFLGETRYVRIGDQEIAAYVDPATHAPTWIIDTQLLSVGAGPTGEIRSESEAAARSAAFLVANAEALRIDIATLGPPLVRSYGDLWFVRYSQQFGIVETWRTRVAMTMDRRGRMVAFGARVLPDGAPATTTGGADTAIPNPVDPADLENRFVMTVAGSIPAREGWTDGVRAPDDGKGSISGRVTANVYRTPDDYETIQERVTGVGFRGGRVDLVSQGGSATVFADDQGRFEFKGLSSPGSYTLRFVMENDRARIVQGIPDSSTIRMTPILLGGPGAHVVQDLDWGWGDDGDTVLSATAAALTTLYHVRLMDDYLRHDLGFGGMATRDRMDIEIHQALPCGACTYPRSHAIVLGQPNAMSGEVAMHEYAHNVLFALGGDREVQRQVFGGDPDFDLREAWALGEGFADYLACAVTDNYAFGGPGKATGDPSFPPGTGITIRLLYNERTAADFSPDWRRNNANGLIIGGAAWMIRTDSRTDPAIVDRTVLLALTMEPWAQSFAQFGRNLLAADRHMNGGRYREVIEEEFVRRNLLPPLEPTLFLHSVDADGLILTWNDRSGVEDGYEIQRRDPGSEWQTLVSLPPNSTEAALQTDPCIAGADALEYRVRVFSSGSGLESFSPRRLVDPCEGAVGIEETTFASPLPGMPELGPPYPNPASASATIPYSLPVPTVVRLVLFDALGRQVADLDHGDRQPGSHRVDLDVTSFPAGTYGIVMTTPVHRMSRILIVVR